MRARPATAGCVHHRRIEEVNGTPFVGSVCVKCGAERVFRAGELAPQPGDFRLDGTEGARERRRRERVALREMA